MKNLSTLSENEWDKPYIKKIIKRHSVMRSLTKKFDLVKIWFDVI